MFYILCLSTCRSTSTFNLYEVENLQRLKLIEILEKSRLLLSEPSKKKIRSTYQMKYSTTAVFKMTED